MDIIILFLSIIISSISLCTATNSLSMELIHRHDKFSTPKNRLLDRLESDSLRVNALSSARQSVSGPLTSGLDLGRLEYVVSLSIGTPPQQVSLAVDTGSGVTWLQCRPCKNCYNETDPTFDPSKSSSFSPLLCGDPLCKQLYYSDSSDCNISNTNPCLYNQSYGDGWFTSGEFSTETLTFGTTGAVDKVAIGCGHDNEGPFDETDGLLALGQSDISFATQTGMKFSYCLSSLTRTYASKSSSIEFGDSAVPPEANFTRLLPNPVYQGYYVGLLGFSVDGKRVNGINSSVFEMKDNGKGGVDVDSLTAFTWLTRSAYKPLRDAFREAFDNKNVLKDTPYALDTCYKLTGVEDPDVGVPTIQLHFDGADVELPVKNYFVWMDYNGTHCLGFGDNGNSGFSIFGNIVQQGFRVSFDLPNNRVGFTANAC